MKNTEYEIRPVAGYEGLYSVSNTGEVFSHDYNGTKQTKQLKPSKDKDGYLMLDLSQDGKQKNHRVHRLVLEAFVPNPYNKPECDHIDTNPSNNHVSNLRWCTRIENNNNPITRKKRSASLKGKPLSEETRRKMSAARQGKKYNGYNQTRYTFRNKNTSEIFIGTRYDFINKYDLKQGGVSELIHGKCKSHKGWIKIYEWGKKI